MTEGKNKVEIAEFEALIAPPEEKEKAMAKKGQAEQDELMRRMGSFLPPPPRHGGKDN